MVDCRKIYSDVKVKPFIVKRLKPEDGLLRLPIAST